MLRRSDYHFDLPPAQIAQTPSERRDASRLLVVGAAAGPGADPDGLADRGFADVVDLLPADAVIVVNDTRVIPARVHTSKDTGGAVELLFVEPAFAADVPAGHTAWRCLAKARRPIRTGQLLRVGAPGAPPSPTAPTLIVVAGRDIHDPTIVVAVPGDAIAFLDAHGELPLPHYIARAGGPGAADAERYQTVYARHPGAVAAPTAGLHLTPDLLDALRARGCTVHPVTLHVGLGTFSPVRVDDLRAHVMHRERYDVPAATAAAIASGRPVVAVGTTVVRTLESAATGRHQVATGPGETRLFIHPGADFQFRVVDHLITNFHLPESTLLMLVCAFAGRDRVLAAYRHAVAAGYRFFSYGDAMLLGHDPGPGPDPDAPRSST